MFSDVGTESVNDPVEWSPNPIYPLVQIKRGPSLKFSVICSGTVVADCNAHMLAEHKTGSVYTASSGSKALHK